jgi:serine protease AprX
MLDVNNALTPAQVKSMMMSTALDWTAPGVDAETGAGRLQAYEAIKRAGSFTGAGPAVPSHFMNAGSLRATNAVDRFSLRVSSITAPIALTLVIPGASATKDFDMVLRAPNGTVLATSNGTTRQETIGVTPTVTGTYTLTLNSYTGSGGYNLDFSYGGTAPVLTADG